MSERSLTPMERSMRNSLCGKLIFAAAAMLGSACGDQQGGDSPVGADASDAGSDESHLDAPDGADTSETAEVDGPAIQLINLIGTGSAVSATVGDAPAPTELGWAQQTDLRLPDDAHHLVVAGADQRVVYAEAEVADGDVLALVGAAGQTRLVQWRPLESAATDPDTGGPAGQVRFVRTGASPGELLQCSLAAITQWLEHFDSTQLDRVLGPVARAPAVGPQLWISTQAQGYTLPGPRLEAGDDAVYVLADDPAGTPMLAVWQHAEPLHVAGATATVRVTQLFPDDRALAVRVDGEVRDLSDRPGWLNIATLGDVGPGLHTFEVIDTGSDAVLWSLEATLEPWRTYVLLASDAGVALVPDDARGQAPDRARISVSHLAAGVGTVDVWALGRDEGRVLLAAGLTRGASLVDVPLDPDLWDLGVDLDRNGTIDDLFPIGYLAGFSPFTVALITDATGELRAGFQLVDQTGVEDERMFANLAYARTAELTVYNAVPAMSVQVQVTDRDGVYSEFIVSGAIASGSLRVPEGPTHLDIVVFGQPTPPYAIDLDARRGRNAIVVLGGTSGAVEGLTFETSRDSGEPASVRVVATDPALGEVTIQGGFRVAPLGVSDPVLPVAGRVTLETAVYGPSTFDLESSSRGPFILFVTDAGRWASALIAPAGGVVRAQNPIDRVGTVSLLVANAPPVGSVGGTIGGEAFPVTQRTAFPGSVTYHFTTDVPELAGPGELAIRSGDESISLHAVEVAAGRQTRVLVDLAHDLFLASVEGERGSPTFVHSGLGAGAVGVGVLDDTGAAFYTDPIVLDPGQTTPGLLGEGRRLAVDTDLDGAPDLAAAYAPGSGTFEVLLRGPDGSWALVVDGAWPIAVPMEPVDSP